MIIDYVGVKEINGSLIVMDGVKGVSNEEIVDIRLDNGTMRQGRVVQIEGERIVVQVFEGTRRISLKNTRTRLTGHPMEMPLSPEIIGRVLDGAGKPIDGLGDIFPVKKANINGTPINPVSRVYPKNYINTGISTIDTLMTLIRGQKLPIFSGSGMKHNDLAVQIVRQAKISGANSSNFGVVFAAMGVQKDVAEYFKKSFEESGVLSRVVMLLNLSNDPIIERTLTPRCALTIAEYLAFELDMHILVIMTDMTSYADALAIVSNRMDQIPSKDSMPGSLYSDLAKIYEKAVQFPSGGSITIIAVTTLSGGDITHAVPDNTGYITEGQLFLRRDSDIGKVIVDPFRSLSRLKQLVTGKKTRKDHPQVMNAAVRLYADAANAKTKLENGFDLTNYDERTLAFAKDYSNQLLAIDVNLNTTEMLDVAWSLFGKYFRPEEVNIKKELVDEFWRSDKQIKE